MNTNVDMAQFVEAKSDQLNSDDLIGAPRTVTITKVVGTDGDQPISIFYEGDQGRPFKPCKSMRRVLLAIWGRYASDYVGRSMTVYRDDKVTFGGLEVGGIRISHMSHLEKETIVVIAKSKGKKAGIKIQPLVVKQQKQPAEADVNRKNAVAWADKHMNALTYVASEDALTTLRESAAKAMVKLERDHPDLYEAVRKAENEKASALLVEEMARGDAHEPEDADERVSDGMFEDDEDFAK